jgi:competence protein ComEA
MPDKEIHLKNLFATLALAVTLVGTAHAQVPSSPSSMPSMGSAKSAAAKASAKASADTTTAKTAASSAGTKATADTSAAKTEMTGKANSAGAAVQNAVDINTAPESDLAALPGVGADNAKKIVAARPFARKDQLVSKKILTKDSYVRIKDVIVARQPAKK